MANVDQPDGPRYWHPFLGQVEASPDGQDIAEALYLAELDHAEHVARRRVEKWQFQVTMSRGQAEELFEAWFQYNDHGCPDGWTVVMQYVERILNGAGLMYVQAFDDDLPTVLPHGPDCTGAADE